MADNNRGVTPEYISLIDRKNSCGESDLNIARRVGMPVYIHISDESQLLLAKKIQIDLSDKGFSVPTIENRHGKVPNLNEIRYYYTEQFQDAKLIKKVSTAYGLEDVLIKPLYAFPTKPTKERAFIEVWLAKPKLPEN